MGVSGQAELTERIIGSAMRVHSELGPGLLESVYQVCLASELSAAGLAVQTEVPVPLRYRGRLMNLCLRLDLVVDDTVGVEIKSVKELDPIHCAQAISYLRLSGYPSVLLLNFNTVHLRDGIRRFDARPPRIDH
jgi:GxxExxY protein